jgi:hypothetical protein
MQKVLHYTQFWRAACLQTGAMPDQVVSRMYPSTESEIPPSLPGPDRVEPSPQAADPSANELFDLYERLVQTQPGTRDAEIFEKIREWTFSDFTRPAYEFAGVTREELASWQKRNRINLSAGHIRPEHIDLQRGYAWGQIRIAAAANRFHGTMGPPSADEIKRSWVNSPSVPSH